MPYRHKKVGNDELGEFVEAFAMNMLYLFKASQKRGDEELAQLAADAVSAAFNVHELVARPGWAKRGLLQIAQSQPGPQTGRPV